MIPNTIYKASFPAPFKCPTCKQVGALIQYYKKRWWRHAHLACVCITCGYKWREGID
jgi:DNA-directed RNA polymerase subunit M/transcription elongation factor TFIIS